MLCGNSKNTFTTKDRRVFTLLHEPGATEMRLQSSNTCNKHIEKRNKHTGKRKEKWLVQTQSNIGFCLGFHYIKSLVLGHGYKEAESSLLYESQHQLPLEFKFQVEPVTGPTQLLCHFSQPFPNLPTSICPGNG